MKKTLFSIVMIWGHFVWAETLVMFLPSPDALHQETFGEFYHTAIMVHGQWWETHPFYGVHTNPTLEEKRLESGVKVLRSPIDYAPPRLEELAGLKGIPFDLHSDWQDLTTLYCTELIAHVLDVYHYAIPISEEGFRIGELGLSPDRLFKKLLEDGFVEVKPEGPSCSGVLTR